MRPMTAAANSRHEATDMNKMTRGRTELTPALESEDGGHEATTALGSCKFGGDDSTERVVATNTDTHLQGVLDEEDKIIRENAQ